MEEFAAGDKVGDGGDDDDDGNMFASDVMCS